MLSAILYAPNGQESCLQQTSQERYVVGPFLLGCLEECERSLDTGRILAEVLVIFAFCILLLELDQ
jgi:hypothetical protein